MTAAAAGGKGKYARGTASRRRTDADDLDSAGRKRPRRRGGRGARRGRRRRSRRRVAAQARGQGPTLRRPAAGRARARRPNSLSFDDAAAAPAPAPVRVAEQESGGTRWAWGRGEAEAPPSMTGAELLDVAARRAAADRAENDDDDAPRSDTAVKSQWEKTLNRDEKSHLGEIHAEAERELQPRRRLAKRKKKRASRAWRGSSGASRRISDVCLRPLPQPARQVEDGPPHLQRERVGVAARRGLGVDADDVLGARRAHEGPATFMGCGERVDLGPGARPAPRAASPSRSAPVAPATPRAA